MAKTFDDAFYYLNGKVFNGSGDQSNRTSVNWDYNYDGQCVSLVKAYLKFLGYGNVNFGNARSWWDNRYWNGILDICDIVSSPKDGDIVVSTANPASVYGHIYILRGGQMFSQNVGNVPYARLYPDTEYYRGQILGYLRPKCLSKSEDRWVKDSIGWWYRNADGSYPKNCWKYVYEFQGSENKGNKYWFYFDSRGYMVEGKWIEWKDKWYYLNKGGRMAANQFIEWGGCTYYVDKDGVMASDKEMTLTVKFDKIGRMKM